VHAKRGGEARGLRADPAHADDERGGLRQVDHAAIVRLPAPLAPELPRQVVLEPARERQDERHDVRADVVVVDLSEIRHHDGMSDQR